MTADDLHLIQFTDVRGKHQTTVRCPVHRGALLELLRASRIGSTSATAPILSRCDDCQNIAAAAAGRSVRRTAMTGSNAPVQPPRRPRVLWEPRWTEQDHHFPCPGGCNQLADECACEDPNPLGSMWITRRIGSDAHEERNS